MLEKLEGVRLATLTDYFYRILAPRFKIAGVNLPAPELYGKHHILEFFRMVWSNFPTNFIDAEESIKLDENGYFSCTRIRLEKFNFLNKRLCDVDWESFMETADRCVLTDRTVSLPAKFVTEQGLSQEGLADAIRLSKISPWIQSAFSDSSSFAVNNLVRDGENYTSSNYRRESWYLDGEYIFEEMKPEIKAYFWSDDFDAASSFGINHTSRSISNSGGTPLIQPGDPMRYYPDNKGSVKSVVKLVYDFSLELEFFADSAPV